MYLVLLTFLSWFFTNLIYKAVDSMSPCVFAVIDHRRHQFVVKLSQWHTHHTAHVLLFCSEFPHFDTSVIYWTDEGQHQGLKKLEIQLALRKSSSQIVLATGSLSFVVLMIKLSHDLPDYLPIAQVKMKSYLPRRKLNLPVQDNLNALFWALKHGIFFIKFLSPLHKKCIGLQRKLTV